jgi:hypothetical protein
MESENPGLNYHTWNWDDGDTNLADYAAKSVLLGEHQL